MMDEPGTLWGGACYLVVTCGLLQNAQKGGREDPWQAAKLC